MIFELSSLLLSATLVAAGPFSRRAVQALDWSAWKQAQQKDFQAVRAFSSTQIKTSEGKCLRIDMFSGDASANLTPVKIADCGSTNGQFWDIITSGKHNDQQGHMLIVSTLTQACFNVDLSRPAGDQVQLFSCGGRPDGSGQTSSAQLFAFDGGAGPMPLQPQGSPGFCLFASGETLGVQNCTSASQNATTQHFSFDAYAAVLNDTQTASAPAGAPSAKVNTTETSGGSILVIPVSRGGVLEPSLAAKANPYDSSAIRPVQRANIRAPDGRCLSFDPSAGDSRQNLIPVELSPCKADDTQRFDIVTKGRHNDGTTGVALLVSTLTNGCVSFDGRRQGNDTVSLFSCGGRADGEGQTDAGQLFPYSNNATSFMLQPQSEEGRTCLVAGPERLGSTSCSDAKQSVFDIIYL